MPVHSTLKIFNHDPWGMYVLCSHDVLPLFLIPFATWDAMRWDYGKRVRKYYVMAGYDQIGEYISFWFFFILRLPFARLVLSHTITITCVICTFNSFKCVEISMLMLSNTLCLTLCLSSWSVLLITNEYLFDISTIIACETNPHYEFMLVTFSTRWT